MQKTEVQQVTNVSSALRGASGFYTTADIKAVASLAALPAFKDRMLDF